MRLQQAALLGCAWVQAHLGWRAKPAVSLGFHAVSLVACTEAQSTVLLAEVKLVSLGVTEFKPSTAKEEMPQHL